MSRRDIDQPSDQREHETLSKQLGERVDGWADERILTV